MDGNTDAGECDTSKRTVNMLTTSGTSEDVDDNSPHISNAMLSARVGRLIEQERDIEFMQTPSSLRHGNMTDSGSVEMVQEQSRSDTSIPTVELRETLFSESLHSMDISTDNHGLDPQLEDLSISGSKFTMIKSSPFTDKASKSIEDVLPATSVSRQYQGVWCDTNNQVSKSDINANLQQNISSVKKIESPSAGSMVGQRRRRFPTIEPPLKPTATNSTDSSKVQKTVKSIDLDLVVLPFDEEDGMGFVTKPKSKKSKEESKRRKSRRSQIIMPGQLLGPLIKKKEFETTNTEPPEIFTKTDNHFLGPVEPEIMLEPSPLEPIVTSTNPAEKTRRRGFFLPEDTSENSKFETKNAELPEITTKTDDHLLATVEPEIMLEPSPLEPIVTNADPAEKTRRRGFFVPDEPDEQTLDFKTQFEDEDEESLSRHDHTPSPPKIKKKTRSRRKSADFHVINSAAVLSPLSPSLKDLDISLPPPVNIRRSRRIRRKSVELRRDVIHPPGVPIFSTDVVKTAGPVSEPVISEPMACCTDTSPNGDVDMKTSVSTSKSKELPTTNCSDKIDDSSVSVCEKNNLEAKETKSRPARSKRTCSQINEAPSIIDSFFSDETQPPKKRGKKRKNDSSVEDIYMNRLWRQQMPTEKSWETIYEQPDLVKASKRDYQSFKRFKRHIDFEAQHTQLKLKRRRQKALKLGWKPLTKKQTEKLQDKFDIKLVEIEEDLADLVDPDLVETDSINGESMMETESSREVDTNYLCDDDFLSQGSDDVFFTPVKSSSDLLQFSAAKSSSGDVLAKDVFTTPYNTMPPPTSVTGGTRGHFNTDSQMTQPLFGGQNSQ